MKREKMLIFNNLKMAVESDSPGLVTDLRGLDDFTRYHLELMLDGGLIRKLDSSDQDTLRWSITWKGHQFYEAYLGCDGQFDPSIRGHF